MKNLILSIMCVCMALAATAGVPEPDVAQARPTLKKSTCVARPATTGTTASTSLARFMQERNLTLDDNRRSKAAPRRLNADDLSGSRISVIDMQVVDSIDQNGQLLLNDTTISMSWNTQAYFFDDYSTSILSGFYDGYDVPIEIDLEAGLARLWSCYLRSDTVESDLIPFHLRKKVVKTDNFLLTASDFFGNDTVNCPLEATIYGDGSMLFDGSFLIYSQIVTEIYKSRTDSLISCDTTAAISPLISNFTVLMPNAIHSCVYHETSGSVLPGVWYSVDHNNSGFVVVNGNLVRGIEIGPMGKPKKPIDPRDPSTPTRASLMSPIGSGLSTKNIIDSVTGYQKPTDVFETFDRLKDNTIDPLGGGRIRRPIDPTNTLPIVGTLRESVGGGTLRGAAGTGLQRTNVVEMIDRFSADPENHTLCGGLVRRPIDPTRPFPIAGTLRESTGGGGVLSLNSTAPDTVKENAMQVPVYISQPTDSLVIVYNLFGLCNGMNCMMIDENGNVNFEGQSVFYDEILNDVFFNYTQEGNFLALGNTGQASTDSIAFGKCYLHGYNKYYTYYYDDNCLYFTDGSQFVIPAAPAPALLGDANNNRVVNISDVTCLINHLLSGEMMNSESFSSEAADVNRDGNLNISDVTALINLLLAQ